MDSFLKDIRYGVRSLMRRPALTIIAIITLAIGIGPTAHLQRHQCLLLKPLPFPEPIGVVAIWDKVPSGSCTQRSCDGELSGLKAQNQSFEQLALFRWWSTNSGC